MKIKHKAPDLLIASQTSWFMATLLFLFVMLFAVNGLLLMSQSSALALVLILGGGGMGVIAICLFVERLQLVLDAQTRTVTISAHTIFNHKWAVISLDDLLYAAAQTTQSSNLTNPTDIRQSVSRTSLVLRDGTTSVGTTIQPISGVYSKDRSAATVVCDINGWLKDLRGTDVLPKPA
jgi:hypothetical protein